MDAGKKHVKPNPLEKANFISKIFFWWLNPLFKLGYKKNLEEDDMFNVLKEDSSEYLCKKLQTEWDKELRKLDAGGKPSLVKAMMRTFGLKYILLGWVALLEESVKVVQPVLLIGFLQYFEVDSTMPVRDAYLYAMGVTFCAIMLAIAHHPYFFSVQRMGMWLRVASCSLIYRKALKLSHTALGETTMGQIVNLMSNDVNRFDTAVIFLHFLWVAPVQALAVLGILWSQMGPSCLAGFAVLLLLIPLQGWMGKVFAKLRSKTAVQTDERVRIMGEVISGMRVIKMYCWEKPFGELIKKIRKLEIHRIKQASYARALNYTPYLVASRLIVFLALLAFVLTGNALTAIKAFLIIGLVNAVRLSLVMFLPVSIQMGSEAKISAKRIQEFLLLDELDQNSSIIWTEGGKDISENGVTMTSISAKWDQYMSMRFHKPKKRKTIDTPTLSNVSIDVHGPKLLAVIGPVGSGKSSLLMSILGELPTTEGEVKVKGKIGYVAQQPWVFSATLRQNVTFGHKFEKAKYEKIMKACALTKDINILPYGDMTLVGERGVSLSGGQRARVSLARALYIDADIYIFDDPLSAVDATVGRHLFEKCINGILKDKPRILVTHQLQYLKAADQILILKEGEVAGVGTYEQLAKEGIDFASLLKHEEEDECCKGDVIDTNGDVKFNLDNGTEPVQIPEITITDITQDKNEQTFFRNTVKSASDYHLHNRKKYQLTPTLVRKIQSTSVQNLYNLRKDQKHSIPLLGDFDADGIAPAEVAMSMPATLENYYLSPSQSSLNLNMRKSQLSLATLTMEFDIEPEMVQIQQQELRQEGTVGWRVYADYFKAGGNICLQLVMFMLFIMAQVIYVLGDWWLSHWSSEEENKSNLLHKHQELFSQGFNQTNITIPVVDLDRNILVLSGLTIALFFVGFIRGLLYFKVAVDASKTLHNKMFNSIIRVPVAFFDNNPVGRILNRFSKDTGHMDDLIPVTMFDFIQCFLMILGNIIVVGVINPWVFIPTVPLAAFFFYIRHYFLTTSRDIKRLEGTTRSPVFSHLSASLQGLSTIRAFKAEQTFIDEFDSHQNLHSEAWFLFLTTTRWFAVRLDWLCASFVLGVCFLSVIAKDNVDLSAGLVGLSITYAMHLMGMFQWGVRQSAEVENQMTSVERVMDYIKLEPEPPLETETKPPSEWPTHGIITGEAASFRYTDDTPAVLKNLYFCIRAKEKVGIVGRTGAGKSSFINMLFRMSEPTGVLRIDGVAITEIGLHDLRQKISIIPQDPVLFTGTVRKNLDPFEAYIDTQLWKALDQVQLKPVIEGLAGGLDAEVTTGGTNFSVGQRQLLCLARAVLRQNKILVIDEATANVDLRTDGLIQQTIRNKFKSCTVLTIAHRLNTIMDSDRVMVLDQGRIKEFDEPYTLLQNQDSMFYKLVQETGPVISAQLFDIAKEAYELHNQPDPIGIQCIPEAKRSHLQSYLPSDHNGPMQLETVV